MKKKMFIFFILAFCMIASAENAASIIDEKSPDLDKIAVNNKTKINQSYWAPYMRDLEQSLKVILLL